MTPGQLADPPSALILQDYYPDLEALEKNFRITHRMAKHVEVLRAENLDKRFEQFALKAYPSYRTPLTIVLVWYPPHRVYCDNEGRVAVEVIPDIE